MTDFARPSRCGTFARCADVGELSPSASLNEDCNSHDNGIALKPAPDRSNISRREIGEGLTLLGPSEYQRERVDFTVVSFLQYALGR
jgi:hypothetical protein